jgi:hypothetical protein
MLYGIQIALYLVAAVIVAGIVFLAWALLQLFRETRREHSRMAQLSYEARWRYRIHGSH